jgi:hypothetical protein
MVEFNAFVWWRTMARYALAVSRNRQIPAIAGLTGMVQLYGTAADDFFYGVGAEPSANHLGR